MPHLTNRFAEVLLHQSAFDSFGTAIASIISTAFVVVLIIAVAVSLVLRRRAGQFAFALVIWVDALALQGGYRVKMGGYGHTVNTHLT